MDVSAGRDRYTRYGYFGLGGVITFAYQHDEVPKSKIRTSTSTSISILEMGAYEKVESSHRNSENMRLQAHSPTYYPVQCTSQDQIQAYRYHYYYFTTRSTRAPSSPHLSASSPPKTIAFRTDRQLAIQHESYRAAAASTTSISSHRSGLGK